MSKDFTVTKIERTARRTFTAPIISKQKFDAIIQSIIGESNPLQTAPYPSNGKIEPGAIIQSETYRSLVNFYDPNSGKSIGTISISANSRETVDDSVDRVTDDETLAGYFGEGAEGYENDAKATWSVRLRLYDPNTEIYYITLNRTTMTMTSFEADEILAKVENWADTVPELN